MAITRAETRYIYGATYRVVPTLSSGEDANTSRHRVVVARVGQNYYCDSLDTMSVSEPNRSVDVTTASRAPDSLSRRRRRTADDDQLMVGHDSDEKRNEPNDDGLVARFV